MTLALRMVNFAIRRVSRTICKIDDRELSRIPSAGPLIIAANHVNFLDAPILFTHLGSRKLTGFVKQETWDNPIMGMLFTMWDAIPLNRNEIDLTAFRKAQECLREKKIIVVAPEGTRSGDGVLQQGHPGLITLALKTRAPILPVAIYGGEKFWFNIKRFTRTEFNIRVGEMFTLKNIEQAVDRNVREQMISEVMYQIAALMPKKYQGLYSSTAQATENYIQRDLN